MYKFAWSSIIDAVIMLAYAVQSTKKLVVVVTAILKLQIAAK